MANQFDRILDESTNRILFQNATVEQCLAQYPEHASELEPHLRVVAQAARAYAFTPSPAAKERGRQLLQRELRELVARDREAGVRKNSWQRWIFGLQPRWAMAIAAVVIVVVVGSSGTVAASGNALPGETLYPVKQATEEVRLALQPSQTGKAKLHLAYAERRAEEAATLVRMGDTQLLEGPATRLRENLIAIARIIDQMQEQQTIDNLKSELNASASQVLASLQAALKEAPQVSQQTATGIFQDSSDAYGNTIETAASRSQDREAMALRSEDRQVAAPSSQDRRMAAAPGVLQVWAVDPPPPKVEKLLIEMGRLEAHLVAGSDSQWVTITTEPQTFDLLRIAEVQRLLGEQKVSPGTYTRVRLQINAVTAVAGGKQYPVKIPSGALSLTRPFRVVEGQTTAVTLDFDGMQSLRLTGQGEYILTPQVSVFAREPEDEDEEPRKAHRRERERKRGKADRALRSAGEGETAPVKVELEGTIEETALDSVVVRGKRIEVAPSLGTRQELQIGRSVEIEAIVRPDGSLVAVKIEPESKKQRTRGDDNSNGSTARVRGVIESISPTEWTIKDHTVRITAETKIKGPPAPGATADVKGLRRPDGSIVAEVIEITPKETFAAPAAPAAPAPPPRPAAVPTPAATPVRVSGDIESISLTQWIVKGQEIIIDEETDIEGTPAVGFKVTIKGTRRPDGRVLAVSIKVQERHPKRPPKEDKEPKQPPTPTPQTDDERPERIRITGTLVELGVGSWKVNGQTVVLTGQTRIEGIPALGVKVEVEGIRQAERKVLAVKVRVLPSIPEGEKPKQPTPTPTPTPTSMPTPTPAPTPTATPQPVRVQLEGVLEQINGLEWRVGGQLVLLSAETEIDGIPVTGVRIRIEGVRRGDGTILVKQVKVLSALAPEK